ncbi:MAG: MaoC family dehydratase [Acidimicrobiales bacterium]
MVTRFEDVELGDELPYEQPDVSMEKVEAFATAANQRFPRFTSHEAARAEGLPGALVPGIMSQALLAAMIHRWAPGATIRSLDTVFRGHVVVGTTPTISGAVTDVDEDARTAEVDLTLTTEEGRTGVMGTAIVAFD